MAKMTRVKMTPKKAVATVKTASKGRALGKIAGRATSKGARALGRAVSKTPTLATSTAARPAVMQKARISPVMRQAYKALTKKK